MRITYVLLVIWMTSSLAIQAQNKFTLSSAISYAMEHHTSMKVAEMNGDDAYWQYKEALAIGMPKLTGNVNYAYYFKTPVNPTQDFLTPVIYGILAEEGLAEPFTGEPAFFELGFIRKNQFTLGLSAEALVFDGNYLKGLKVAKKFIQLTRDQIVLTEQDIHQNVTRAYQNVLIGLQSIQIIDNNIANIQRSLNETQIIYENGFVEELDVDRLKLSLENLQNEREKTERLYEVSLNVLKYEMAFPLDQDLEVVDELEDTVNGILLRPEDPSLLIDYDKRPEHRLLNDAIELDRADLDRIKMGYYPTVSANIGFDESLQRDKFFDSSEAGFLGSGSIGLKARVPIYDGGDIKAKVQRKKIQLDQREIELFEFERAMTLQVMNARKSFQNAKWALESSTKSLRLNEKIYDKTQIKYKEGVGSSVEVTQAEASLYQAQANYINALYDLLVARTELDIVTGELLKLNN